MLTSLYEIVTAGSTLDLITMRSVGVGGNWQKLRVGPRASRRLKMKDRMLAMKSDVNTVPDHRRDDENTPLYNKRL